MPSLGDAIYCRPFVLRLARKHPIWIETRWPDLYGDIEAQEGGPQGPDIRPRYNSKTLCLNGIARCIEGFFPPDDGPLDFDLPAFPKPEGLGRYAVIRPPTLRKDFYGPARNPTAGYVRRATDLLRSLGLTTVLVGNVRSGLEWFDGEPPQADHDYSGGELNIPELMGLLSGASLVVGGPGWQVPASIAYGVPCCIVYGGAGAANRPKVLLDPRMDASRVAWVMPDRFCRSCRGVLHDCDKTITDFDNKFLTAIHGLLDRA